MFLLCRPDASISPIIKAISDLVLITWSLKYEFWSEILNLTLMITCYDIKTSICSVSWISVHLLVSLRSLIFALITWSSKFGFSSGIFKIRITDNLLWYKDMYLICKPDVITSLCTKQSLILVSIIWYKVWILKWDWLHGGLVILNIL